MEKYFYILMIFIIFSLMLPLSSQTQTVTIEDSASYIEKNDTTTIESSNSDEKIWISYKPFQYGFRFGISLSTFWGSNNTGDDKWKPYFSTGALLILNYNEYFAIQGEIGYLRKGSEISVIGDKKNVKLDYIYLPIQIKYSFYSIIHDYPYITLGPYFGYCYNAEINNIDKNTNNGINLNDFGITYGFGYNFRLDNFGKIFVEARYEMGLTDVFQEPYKLDLKNSAFLISIGIIY